MKRSRTTLMGTALLGLSLVAAACGGDDDDEGAATATTDGSTATTEESTGTTRSSTATTKADSGPLPTTEAAWEDLWEAERAAILTRISEEGFGVSADGATVTGPEGFTIDLSKCPAGWSDTEGLSDTEIKIGHTTALSGTLADYGNIAGALQVQFDKLNAAGGIKDATGKSRAINLIVRDDGYDATRTIPLVDELIDAEQVFAMWTLGSPNTLRTYDKLNGRCIPQPLSMTGHPAWGDPVNHPWTTGMQLAYNTEAVLWGAFLEQRIDELAPNGGTIKVASLVLNNDGGKAFDAPLRDFLAQSPIKDRVEYVSELIEPQAPTITDPMTTLASGDPDVFIAMVAGTFCTQSIVEAANNGMKESTDYLFLSSVCAGSSFVGSDKVGGDAADGWWIVNGGLKDINSPAFADDPMVQLALADLRAAGTDPKASGSFGLGYGFGWPTVQTLRIASEMEGGLTRSGFIVALRSMDMTHPYLYEGIQFNMNGNADAYLVEGGAYQTRDAAAEVWVTEGEVIDLSGRSKSCAWDQGAGVCR